jgi:hypothetical protein
MPDLRITAHAVDRYRERVADLPDADIRRAIDCPAVRAGVEFGACYVRLGGGQRIVLEGNVVVTVLPRFKPLHQKCDADG